MTVRKFMLKKFPPNKWMDCPIPKEYWKTMQEYADAYHEWKVKNISPNLSVTVELPDYELDFCEKCFQMTNHLSSICQKCKGN